MQFPNHTVPHSKSPYTKFPVLFEDEALILVNKPEGILSHPNLSGGGKPSGSAFEGRYHHDERRFDTPAGSLWLVHRLDQDTSGVLLAAKSEVLAERCRGYFEDQKIEKIYVALVEGRLPQPSGIWKDHLHKRSGDGMVRSEILRGRPPNAELHYKVQQVFRLPPKPDGSYVFVSYLNIVLRTGRTHQIRVQAASRGHSVTGDRVYGNFGLNKYLKTEFQVKRLLLHALKLRFKHPKSGVELTIEASLPEEFIEVMALLKAVRKQVG